MQKALDAQFSKPEYKYGVSGMVAASPKWGTVEEAARHTAYSIRVMCGHLRSKHEQYQKKKNVGAGARISHPEELQEIYQLITVKTNDETTNSLHPMPFFRSAGQDSDDEDESDEDPMVVIWTQFDWSKMEAVALVGDGTTRNADEC
eukprot:6523490-Pyramimonas_sp.AAC.1